MKLESALRSWKPDTGKDLIVPALQMEVPRSFQIRGSGSGLCRFFRRTLTRRLAVMLNSDDWPRGIAPVSAKHRSRALARRRSGRPRAGWRASSATPRSASEYPSGSTWSDAALPAQSLRYSYAWRFYQVETVQQEGRGYGVSLSGSRSQDQYPRGGSPQFEDLGNDSETTAAFPVQGERAKRHHRGLETDRL